MKTLEQKEFEYLVTSGRKNPRLVVQTLGKTILDAGKLAGQRKRPYFLGQALYEGCKAIADYAHTEPVENIVLVDKSARPLWIGIAKYWNLAHPESKRPAFHFINPAYFKTSIRENSNPQQLQKDIAVIGNRCKEELLTSGSSLADKMDEPVLLADACMHSGRAVYLTKRVLEEAGFSDIRLGVIKTTLPSGGMVDPEVYGSNNVLAAQCLRSEPGSGLVANSETSIFSQAAHNADATLSGARVRLEIGETIIRQFLTEN